MIKKVDTQGEELLDGMRALVYEVDTDRNSAFWLWAFLPSHEIAKLNHGDPSIPIEYHPSAADVMEEAAPLISALLGREIDDRDLSLFRCPCDRRGITLESDVQVRERVRLWIARSQSATAVEMKVQ